MTDLRDTPFAGLYGLIYMDPNWHFATHSAKGQGKSASQHYGTLTVPQLIDLRLPVSEVAAPDCWLAMWITMPMMYAVPGPRELIASYDDPANPWRYVSAGAWAKRPRNWRGDPTKWAFGTGYTFRNASEVLTLWRRGSPRWTSKAVRGLWDDPIRQHSRKPDSARDDLARACPGPRLEMFARTSHPGFDGWGMEAGRLDGR